ncbi:hypothetical protein [Mumia sp. DW29H23]|uniref:hypothetical protein n=1 Tax=Mumia sp. DW29H23 TaxID=3421241 RepID=UPI003D68C65B
MIRTLRTAAVAAATVALVVTATAAPAAAKTRTFADKSEDAVAALDITKVKVTNKKHAVVVRMTVPGFKKSQLGGVIVAIRTKGAGRPMFTAMKLRTDAWAPVDLVGEDGTSFPCKGDRVSFGKRSVTVRVPQRCLGLNKKAVRVGAALAGRDWLTMEEEPKEGPDAVLDVYPKLTSDKLSPWVRYR